MAIKTQGSELFVLHEGKFVKVACPTTMSVGGSSVDQLETTCLDMATKTFIAGLKTPGQVTFEINTDPRSEAHRLLFALSEADDMPNKTFLLGWSDGKSLPTVAGETATIPTDRTWLEFDGYISDFPFDFATNSIVKSSISIQVSGSRKWHQKDEDPVASSSAVASVVPSVAPSVAPSAAPSAAPSV